MSVCKNDVDDDMNLANIEKERDIHNLQSFKVTSPGNKPVWSFLGNRAMLYCNELKLVKNPRLNIMN
jgi:hypothetical protein